MKQINNTISKEQLVKFLVDNFKDEDGYLDLAELDFKNEDIKGVDISKMKVKGSLNQHCQKVSGDLFQDAQFVKGKLYQ